MNEERSTINIYKFIINKILILILLLLLLDSASGALRLSAEGASVINDKNRSRSEFIENLKNGLARVVSMSSNQLSFIKDQFNYSASPPTPLILFKIMRPVNGDDPQEINVAQVINDLSSLIKK